MSESSSYDYKVVASNTESSLSSILLVETPAKKLITSDDYFLFAVVNNKFLTLFA